jgi:hypothetical protein
VFFEITNRFEQIRFEFDFLATIRVAFAQV